MSDDYELYADYDLSMSQAGMVTSIDDVEEVNWWNQQPAVQTDMHAQVDMDSETADSFAIPSTDGRGETLEELNSPCPWITAADNEDNAVNETLDLSASSRVMSLSAYVTEDEFEDDTEFGDAMMRLDVFEDFQIAKKWTIGHLISAAYGDFKSMPVQHKPDDVTTVVTALRKQLGLDELRPKQAGGSPVKDAAPAEDDGETRASGVEILDSAFPDGDTVDNAPEEDLDPEAHIPISDITASLVLARPSIDASN